MSEINNLTISISERDGCLVALCKELDIQIECHPDEDLGIETLLSELSEDIEHKLIDLLDKGQINRSPIVSAIFAEGGEHELRYQIRRKQIEDAFVKNYPNAEGHWNAYLLVPRIWWDNDAPEWDARQENAMDALVNEGKDSPVWIEWAQMMTALEIQSFVEYQRKDRHQRSVDLGLPVLPYEECLKYKAPKF